MTLSTVAAAAFVKFEVVSSWKLDNSSTYATQDGIQQHQPEAIPDIAANADIDARRCHLAHSAVTVLLPFEPVMATIGAYALRGKNSSISPTISLQRWRQRQERMRQSNTVADD